VARDLSCGDLKIYLAFAVRRVTCERCGTVKRARLNWLADHPFYTKRFAFFVGRRCRATTILAVARALRLDRHSVKELEKLDRREQWRRAGRPRPQVLGIDAIAIGKGHTYRIVVSDLWRRRPIGFGGTDRSEESLSGFFQELGKKTCQGIKLAVLDRWKPVRNATLKPVPGSSILFDKCHIIAHLGEALDQVRTSEYARLTGKNRQFIQGRKDTLLSNHANLTWDGRRSLAKLLQANKRLHTAYGLKECFGSLWNYRSEAWARRFFENWKPALKWQRLKPYEKFARMIDEHWDGIAAYCQPQNKVPLGFVEGVNNKIRVIQRRAYGLRDEEYLRLKILTCMLPEV